MPLEAAVQMGMDFTEDLLRAGFTVTAGHKPGPTHFSPVEKKIIEGVRELPVAEQEMVLSVVNTLVQIRNRNFRKTRQ